MLNADNYKGIFYKEEKITKYYEGGAHFKYEDLVYALNCILKKNNNTLHREDSTTSLNIDKVKTDSKTINNCKGKENARFNTLEKDINSKPKVNNLIKINFNNNFLNNKILLNTEKNRSKQKQQKNLIISLINDSEKNKTEKRNQSQFHGNNLKLTKINNNKISTLLNNCSNKNIFNENRNFQTIISDDENTFRSYSKYLGSSKKNNLPLIQSSYFNKMSKKISLKFNKQYDEAKKYKFNIYSPTRNLYVPGYYKDSEVFTDVKNEGFNGNDANKKYDEVVNKILKNNNNFASIEIIKNIDKSNDDRLKKLLKNMKKREDLKGYKNIFDMQQNTSRDRKIKLTEIKI